MELSRGQGIEGNTFVVTGGLGFVGAKLCLELLRRGASQVRSFDLRAASPWSDDLVRGGVVCIRGDVTRKEDVEKALQGADCVFHLVSYGMSGKEMLQVDLVNAVNVRGTCNVLLACIKCEVPRLVYVSTHNVVFKGKEIKNGDERLPYVPIDDYQDVYSCSKTIAEQLVLKSNGRPFKNSPGKRLYTCAVRPPAIYGPGEERHLPRVVSLAKWGLLLFKTGEPSVVTDWIYVDNLVLALILASKGLLNDLPGKEGNPVAAGQPYFVSDGAPVNCFEFLRPLLKSLDYDVPRFTVPVPCALFVGKIFQGLYVFLSRWLNNRWLAQTTMLLPAELTKVSVTHYFSIDKAKEELGYVPVVTPTEGMAATIAFWQEQKRKSLDGPPIFTWSFVLLGMAALFAAAWLPNIGPTPFLRTVSLFFFRSVTMIRMVFILAMVAHTGEAIYAWLLAKKVDPANAKGWFWQTFALGIFSLRFLLKRARKQQL